MLPAHYYRGLLSEPHIASYFFLGVLYLNKLVTGLKNVDPKWCEEKLEPCLSAPICSFHSFDRNTAVSETLVGGKTQEKKKVSTSVFQQSDCYSPKADKTHFGPNHRTGIYCRLENI